MKIKAENPFILEVNERERKILEIALDNYRKLLRQKILNKAKNKKGSHKELMAFNNKIGCNKANFMCELVKSVGGE